MLNRRDPSSLPKYAHSLPQLLLPSRSVNILKERREYLLNCQGPPSLRKLRNLIEVQSSPRKRRHFDMNKPIIGFLEKKLKSSNPFEPVDLKLYEKRFNQVQVERKRKISAIQVARTQSRINNTSLPVLKTVPSQRTEWHTRNIMRLLSPLRANLKNKNLPISELSLIQGRLNLANSSLSKRFKDHLLSIRSARVRPVKSAIKSIPIDQEYQICAMQWNNKKLSDVRSFIRANPNSISVSNSLGRNCLHWAVSMGREDLFQLFLEAGAVMTRDSLGMTPAELARKKGTFKKFFREEKSN